MARVVVDVMLKPEILDPQGQAIAGACSRLGFEGIGISQPAHSACSLPVFLCPEWMRACKSADHLQQVRGHLGLPQAWPRTRAAKLLWFTWVYLIFRPNPAWTQ